VKDYKYLRKDYMRHKTKRKWLKAIVLLHFLLFTTISLRAMSSSNYPLTFRNISYSYELQEVNQPLYFPHLRFTGLLIQDKSSSFLYKQQVAPPQEATPMSLAEVYLRQLTENKRSRRKAKMTFGYIGGGVCLALGGLALHSASNSCGWEGFGDGLVSTSFVSLGAVGFAKDASSVSLGAVGVASGVYSSFPSRAE
jgi:hypothetical protein